MLRKTLRVFWTPNYFTHSRSHTFHYPSDRAAQRNRPKKSSSHHQQLDSCSTKKTSTTLPFASKPTAASLSHEASPPKDSRYYQTPFWVGEASSFANQKHFNPRTSSSPSDTPASPSASLERLWAICLHSAQRCEAEEKTARLLAQWSAECFHVKQAVLGPLQRQLARYYASMSVSAIREEVAGTAPTNALRPAVEGKMPLGQEGRERVEPLSQCPPSPSSSSVFLRVVSDEEAKAIDQKADSRQNSVFDERENEKLLHDDPPQQPLSLPLSRKELMECFALYALADCEDGTLLQNLMNQLQSHYTAAAPINEVGEGGGGGATVGQFLFVLSQLKVIKEDLLAVLLHSPRDAQESSKAAAAANSSETSVGTAETDQERVPLHTLASNVFLSNEATAGVLYKELPAYTFSDLLLLGAGLHRFGLHEHLAWKRCVKRWQALQWTRASDLGRFAFAMAKLRQREQGRKKVGRRPEAAVRASLEAVLAQAIHPAVLPPTLVLDVSLWPLLLEWLHAASLSPYRSSHFIQCIADILAVNAHYYYCSNVHHREQQTTNRTGGVPSRAAPLCLWPFVLPLTPVTVFTAYVDLAGSEGVVPPPTKAAAALGQSHASLCMSTLCHRTSQLLWSATQRTAAMDLPQPLLEVVLEHWRSASGKGVVTDGGEASDALNGLDPSRVAFYDHVSADLIKVNRAD